LEIWFSATILIVYQKKNIFNKHIVFEATVDLLFGITHAKYGAKINCVYKK